MERICEPRKGGNRFAYFQAIHHTRQPYSLYPYSFQTQNHIHPHPSIWRSGGPRPHARIQKGRGRIYLRKKRMDPFTRSKESGTLPAEEKKPGNISPADSLSWSTASCTGGRSLLFQRSVLSSSKAAGRTAFFAAGGL